MNSSSSTLLDSVLKTLLSSLDTLEGLHIGSIEFTVEREKTRVISLLVEILYLPEEKENQIP